MELSGRIVNWLAGKLVERDGDQCHAGVGVEAAAISSFKDSRTPPTIQMFKSER
jgi:hypothetical protein